MSINRGGRRMSLIKSTAFGVPPIIIGHLDQAGKDLLDEKLKGSSTIPEIVEFFKHYVPQEKITITFTKSPRRPSKKSTEVGCGSENMETGSKKTEFNIKENDNGNLISAKKMELRDEIFSEEDEEDENENFNQNSCGNDTNLPIIEITAIDTDTLKTLEKEPIVESKPIQINLGRKKERNIFDILDADYLTRMIPYMHPDSQKCTFRFFFDRVHEVCDGKGLGENEIIDVIQFRMGGSYLAETKILRGQQKNLVDIEKYFLQKDKNLESEKIKKEKLLKKTEVGYK